MSAILAAGMVGGIVPNFNNLWMGLTNTIDWYTNYAQWRSEVPMVDSPDSYPYFASDNSTVSGGLTYRIPARNDASQFWQFTGSSNQTFYYPGIYVSNNSTYYGPAFLRDSFSWNIWFRYRDPGLGRKIIGCQNETQSINVTSYDRHFYVGTDRYLYWGAYNTVSSSGLTIKSLNTLNANQWYMASVYLSDGTYYMFLDGVYQGFVSILGQAYTPPLFITVAGSVLTGWPASVSGQGQYWTGDIHSIYIYQRGMTGSEILNLYNATREWPGKNL